MAENKKSKSGLEDIARHANLYAAVSEIAKEEIPFNQRYDSFCRIYMETTPKKDLASLQPLFETWQTNPYAFFADVDKKKKEIGKDLASATEKALEKAIAKLDEKTVKGLAVGISPSEDYIFYATALANQDADAVAKRFREDYKDNKRILKSYGNASPHKMLGYAQFMLNQEIFAFERKKLYSTVSVEIDGKKEKQSRYDSAKARKYLRNSIIKLKDKTEKEELLTQLGLKIAMTLSKDNFRKKKKAA